MENNMGFTSRIVLPSLLLVAGAVPAISQRPDPGAVFAMTNRAGNNEVIAFRRAADGALTETGRYSTGGHGIGVDFDAQGGLRLSADHRKSLCDVFYRLCSGRAYTRLEPDDGKPSSPVLRGGSGSNAVPLPDSLRK